MVQTNYDVMIQSQQSTM